jgi:hypothetical protein
VREIEHKTGSIGGLKIVKKQDVVRFFEKNIILPKKMKKTLDKADDL